MHMRHVVNKTAFLVLLFLAFFAGKADAKNVVFTKEYTYRASEMDSKISSRTIALQEVKRALLEQLGVYLLSETVVRDYKMSKEQITTLTAGIVGAEIIREQWDGMTYYLQAKITVDPQDVVKRVKELGDDKVKTRELEDARKKSDAALKEIERLKEELELTRADMQRQFRRQTDYTHAIQELGVDDWFSGFRFTLKDGGTFIWKTYEAAGDSYCNRQDDGSICILMSDVASIKKGEYPDNVEVISTLPISDQERRQAARDWKTIEMNNEKTRTDEECRLMHAELQRQQDAAKYHEQLIRYQDVCGGLRAPEPEHVRQQKYRPSGRKNNDEKKNGMDNIIRNANDGAVF
jgi:hypothetical protein